MILAVIIILICLLFAIGMAFVLYGAFESWGWTKAGRERTKWMKQIHKDAEDMKHFGDLVAPLHSEQEFYEAEREARGDAG